jgi:hypothetical protein
MVIAKFKEWCKKKLFLSTIFLQKVEARLYLIKRVLSKLLIVALFYFIHFQKLNAK